MNQEYVDTVRLLLAIAPAVFQPPRFALKGGTALNLYLQDMPRLSVDIDIVFTDHTLDRESALRAIAADLKVVKSAISAMGYRAALPTTKSSEYVGMTRDEVIATSLQQTQDRLITQLPRELTAILSSARRTCSKIQESVVASGCALFACVDPASFEGQQPVDSLPKPSGANRIT